MMEETSLTLDQLRVLVSVVDAGSFSSAARRLRRAQSAVSTQIKNLEIALGLELFDRSTRVPTATESGAAMVARARLVLEEVARLEALAVSMNSGVEARVSLCVDAIFPMPALVELCRSFAAEYPHVELRVETEAMTAVTKRVLDGRATLGVVGPAGEDPKLTRIPLARVRMIPVVGRDHPLSRSKGRLRKEELARHVQIVLSERSERDGAETPDQAVLGTRTWRVAELATKRELLLAGLGWGNLPEHLVERDLRKGALVAIRPAAWAEDEHTLMLSAVHARALGPAHRWVVGALSRLCTTTVGLVPSRRVRAPPAKKRGSRRP
jgi:DNA-binding transcriptional LysR family regulator